MILAAIAEAQVAGARLAQACRLVGISARTVERWRSAPDADDGRWAVVLAHALLTSARDRRAVELVSA